MRTFRQWAMALGLIGALMVAAGGCIWLGVGAAGIVGGYAVSPDTVEGTLNFAVEQTYDAVKEVTGIMGQIVDQAPNASGLTATINGARVTVTLTAVSASSTKISIKARKAFMPKIDIAQDVYAKIVNSLAK